MNKTEFVQSFAPEALLLNNHDNAILGVGSRCGMPTVAIYDAEMIRCNFRLESGMSEHDAIEFFNFNVAGAYLGENTPIFVELYDTGNLLQQIKKLKEENTKLLLKIAEHEAREY